MRFYTKSYGRIFVDKQENIERVKEIIKEMDDFEYTYLPDDLITVFDSNTFDTTYTHKFDSLDLGELMNRCWKEGIHIFCVTGAYGDAVYA